MEVGRGGVAGSLAAAGRPPNHLARTLRRKDAAVRSVADRERGPLFRLSAGDESHRPDEALGAAGSTVGGAARQGVAQPFAGQRAAPGRQHRAAD